MRVVGACAVECVQLLVEGWVGGYVMFEGVVVVGLNLLYWAMWGVGVLNWGES